MKNRQEIEKLKAIARGIRIDLAELACEKTIHIGGDLSVVDIITVLWHKVMNYDTKNPNWEERDRFILSKGHCAVTVSLAQARLGIYTREDIFQEYGTDNCRFSMSPCKHTNPYFESSATGSLGQGLSIGAGMASAIKAKGNTKSKVYVVVGDGELQEGSNWEAIMYASQAKLGNLCLIIDNNKLQFDGKTAEIVNIDDISERFAAFGWKVLEVDGNDISKLIDIFERLEWDDKPIVINAHTIKGKGIPYMEGNYLWHAGKIDKTKKEETISYLMN